MRLLVLGGTKFVGRAVVSAALDAGFPVTVLNDEPDGPHSGRVEELTADRRFPEQVAAALRHREWDIVFDTWRDRPSAVEFTASRLRDVASVYCYVSSVSVYAASDKPLSERSATIVWPSGDARDYPARKLRAERAVQRQFGERALILRPGLIVGPWEYAGRLPWWLRRFHKHDRLLCPGPADRHVQWLDCRDLADWFVTCAKEGITGLFNLAGPAAPITMGDVLLGCRAAVGREVKLHWLDAQRLVHAGVDPWHELPLWIPPLTGQSTAYDIDATRAARGGARYLSAAQTITDVWSWMSGLGEARLTEALDARSWLTRSKELRILDTIATG